MERDYKNPNDNWYYHQKELKSGFSYKVCFYCFMAMIVLIILLIILTSCKSIQYIPVEKIKTEYKHTTDTIKQTDSIFSEKETIIREADSALVAKLGLQLKANERAILVLKRELERQVNKQSEQHTDTVIKTDTIQVPYPVEKKLTKWQQFKLDAGNVGLGLCALVLIALLMSWYVKIKS